MHRNRKTIMALASSSLLLLTSFNYAASFNDITGHRYQDSVEYLHARGVVKGYPDGSYGPDRNVTRAEMMKIILEANDGDRIPDLTNCFPDVNEQRFAKYVCFAKQHTIVRGYPDGEFKPQQSVTIAEALKMSFESFDVGVEEGEGTDRYQPYIDFAHANTIFSKYAIFPDRPITRGEMAHLAHQLMLRQQGNIDFDSEREVRSIGCAAPAPDSPPTSVTVDGQQRNFLVDVGSEYTHKQPTPLLIAFHGRTNANTRVRRYYDLNDAADGEAIIVYPSGLPEEGPTRNRSDPGDPTDQLRDFELFDKIVQTFQHNYCINNDQIFVAGHSLGARFANSLACARGDTIRALGSVGGSTTSNECTGPVAAVVMHNPEDRLASFESGLYNRDQLLAQNRCGPQTEPVGPADGNCVKYTNCLAGAPVIWCPHTDSQAGRRGSYYPHTRPDFAGQMIRDFFEEQTQ